MKYVIIGNGVAAAGAVDGIREIDADGAITVISSEPYEVYGRPLISNLLRGEIVESAIYCRPEDYYETNRVDLLLDKTVTKIDAKKHKISLDTKKTIAFDKLLVATGGVPFFPPIKGQEGKDIYTFTTLEDAHKLEALVGKVKKIVVLGGGLIGLKAAEGLHDRGIHVTVVELADRILSSAFDQTAGAIIAKRLGEVGIDMALGNSIKQIARKNGRVKNVVLQDKRTIDCDAVVIAVGVVPNLALVADSGLKANRGILTDEYMETNIPGVFAAGDVAEAYDLVLGERRVTPIWPNAYLQGKYAGLNMAGASRRYPGGCAMNAIEFYGIPTVSMGLSNPPEKGYDVLTKLNTAANTYKKLVLKDGILVGAVLVGNIDRAGILTGFIQGKVNVADFKDALLKDDFGLVHLPQEIRTEMLAGRM